MERSSLGCKQVDEGDFNLKEWGVRARRISRENTNISRRFSASNFREEARSFRSNASTASSPGYTARGNTHIPLHAPPADVSFIHSFHAEEFDPSTYSFTTALKALQAKTVYTWEFQSPDGLTLNSKWNEAEKYICNPLSGEVPLECLSAKTLSGRSFRGLSSRITMSAPLIYPSQMHHFHANQITSSNEKKKKSGTTRDVGTQSTPAELSSSSPTPAPTPSIEERSIKGVDIDSSLKSDDSEVEVEVEVKVEERREREGGERKMMSRCSNSQGGCLSLRALWMRTLKQRDKHKPRTNMLSTFLHHLNACSKQ